MTRIILDAVSVTLLNRAVIRDVSATLSERRIAVVGRNGSGKSTLMRSITGLIPYEGQILLGDRPANGPRKELLGQVGLLFQNPDHQIIFPTVKEELSFGLKALGLSKRGISERVDHILAEFGRSDWRERSVSTLSGGQKQLLCLMTLLVLEPKILILDEPFTGLDLPVRHALERILERQPTQILHVTHDPRDIEAYDRVIWMDEGRILLDGSPDAVIPAYVTQMEQISDAFADR
ncbi:MAG: ABC transporter ATP-binding protein [Paracoccaceae bacterium]